MNIYIEELRECFRTWYLESYGMCTLAGAAREMLSWRDDPEADFPDDLTEQHGVDVLTRIANFPPFDVKGYFS